MVAEWDLPFRRAKKAVEKAVRYSEAEGVDKISLNAFRRALKEEKITVSADQRFIDRAQDPKTLVGLRRITGGPAPAVLQENIVFLNRAKKSLLKWVSSKRRKISSAESLLRKREKAL
jgi:argininosuccinate lyase